MSAMERSHHGIGILVLLVIGGAAACGDPHYDDDVNIGTMRQGETREVEAHAYAARPSRLEECDTAYVIGLRGPNGSRETLGDNIDAVAFGVVRQNSRGECESKVRITVGPNAAVGFYSIEVEFEYFLYGDNRRRDVSGFIDLRVAAALTPTPTATATATPIP